MRTGVESPAMSPFAKLLSAFCLLPLACLPAAAAPPDRTGDKAEIVLHPNDPLPPPAKWALAIHGGAGTIPKDLPAAEKQEYMQALTKALTLGKDMLAKGATSLDTVEAVVRWLEDDPHFNAGKGAVFTHEGT
ncbi:MAG: isoaspartyl peptidase/L-asparaginase, partial [Acidobacteriota bacterium]